MRRIVLVLAVAALVAVMLAVSAAPALAAPPFCEDDPDKATTSPACSEKMPKTGGMTTTGSAVLLPAGALLLGTGVLTYAIVRRRW